MLISTFFFVCTLYVHIRNSISLTLSLCTVDYCHGQQCGTHGLCRNDFIARTYYCECDAGWIGDNCDMQRCDHLLTCTHGARCQ